MKFNNNFKHGLHSVQSVHNITVKSIVFMALFFTGVFTQLNAQDTLRTRPSWWFGGAVGANFNFYDGSIQKINSDLRAPIAFHKGFGIGLFAAPLVEYYKPNTVLGFMLQAGYDGRSGKFDQQLSPCNCPRDLSTKLGYITIEPSLRLAPFKSNFYFFVGPRFAFNMKKSFTYQEKPNPDISGQITEPDVKGDLGDMKKSLISMQIGAGYDIQLSSMDKKTQWVISPFASFHPYFGQEPRTIETWTVSTVRFGAAFKLGRGGMMIIPEKSLVKKDTATPKIAVVIPKKAAIIPAVRFSVNATQQRSVTRTYREIYPLRNYVFYNVGSTEIPGRYTLLKKNEVAGFKANNVQLSTPDDMTGRAERQMIVYYNILNILGDRMVKNPSTSITLVGSSEKGAADARIMAESIKTYLTDVFGISASRISIEGRDKPKIPSEQAGQKNDLALLKEGDRRVSIETNSPVLLSEFQSGPVIDAQGNVTGNTSRDSNVIVNVSGAKAAYASWTLQVKDEKGRVQYYGPFTEEKVKISESEILGAKPEGDYKLTMMGKTKDGKSENMDTTVHLAQSNVSSSKDVMRFSIIYEFNDSKAIAIYEKYLTEVVLPKIPSGGKVIIHGYSDIIGDADYNQKLSLARANDVKGILERALRKAGRNDVQFEVNAYGENESDALFSNTYPEGRFYNRSVTIDILPK